jgi:periplasmic protein TonB
MLLLAEQNRAFGYAIAASLVLHALILALRVPTASRPAEPPAAEPPLVAHLAEPPPPPPPAPIVQKPPPAKPVAKAKAKPKPLARPAPRPIAPREEPAAEEKAEEIMAPPAPAPAPSPAPPVAAVAPRAAPAPDTAAMLAGFRRQLVAVAVRYKRYPRIALDNGWSGDVAVRIEVDANGAVSSIKVKTSSGHEVLDEQALEMFRKAAAEVPVPAALRGKAFPVEVRAIYNLQDRPG